jgi:hypothetical protein
MKYQENNINIPSPLALKVLNRSEAEVGLVATMYHFDQVFINFGISSPR